MICIFISCLKNLQMECRIFRLPVQPKVSKNTIRIMAMSAIRLVFFGTFLNTTSNISPTPSNSTPITRKSKNDQFTSEENCIPINGISNSKGIASRIVISLLFLFMIFIYFNNCSIAFMCFLNASLPVSVAKYFVLGFRSRNSFL